MSVLHRRFRWIALLMIGWTLLLFPSPAESNPVPGTDVTYTLDADFNQGTTINLNHAAPNSNQLQISQNTQPLPFLNVAASLRGTVVRIDINTGAIVGEYWTSPNGMGRNPSRTTVDKLGNVWVSNRNENSQSGGSSKGSVARIGIILGGTRVDASGTPNATGQYLAPPYTYNTCLDRSGATVGSNPDGLIKTSNGLANILPWTNNGVADTHGGVSTAEDECILNYTRVTGENPRTVAVDPNNDVWVGGYIANYANREHEKLSGVTGLPVPGTQFNMPGFGGYGGLVDCNGVLWSAGRSNLLRFDPNAGPPPGSGQGWSDRGNYGLGIDPTTGHIWHSSNSGGTNTLYELDTNGAVLNSYPQPFITQGLAVDQNSHVWVAESYNNNGGTRVWHLAPDPANLAGPHIVVGNVTGFGGTTGVAVDANGKIWVTERTANRVSRIDPSLGAVGGGLYPIGAIDLSVNIGSGAAPYNYSDMTGMISLGVTSPSGLWSVVQDSGAANSSWGTISWNTEPQGSVPSGTSIVVEARSSNTQIGLASQAFIPVPNGTPILPALTGQFIEVRASLMMAGSTQCYTAVTPVLSDLRIRTTATQEPECATVKGVKIGCKTDGSGYEVTFSVTNQSGLTVDEIMLTPPVGSGYAFSPQQFPLPTPLANGQTVTLTTTIIGAPDLPKPGSESCFFVTLLQKQTKDGVETLKPCCTVRVCVRIPECKTCLKVIKEEITPVEGSPGQYNYTFVLQNLTSHNIQHVYLHPPAGVTMTPSYFALSPALPPNGTTNALSVTVTFSGPAPNPLCFQISLHDSEMRECCLIRHCISLDDKTPPHIECPPDKLVYASSNHTVVTYPAPTATDSGGGPVTVTCTPPSGSSFPLGTTEVTCTATDESGNVATCRFRIRVKIPIHMDDAVTIDGVLNAAEWEEVPVFELSGFYQNVTPMNWSGPQDYTGRLRLKWNSANLFFAAEVMDDVLSFPSTEETALHLRDGLQLFLGLKQPQDPERMAFDQPGDYEINLSADADAGGMRSRWYSPQSPRTITGSPAGVRVARMAGGYLFEGAIPWASLEGAAPPVVGQTLGFNAVGRDNDQSTPAEDTALSLSSLDGSESNPSRWVEAELLGTTETSIRGDVDGNKSLNVADAVMSLRMVVGLVEGTPEMRSVGDINKDGNLNVADAVLILRIIVGLEQAG